jgi:peptidoglycan/LPS O-acetylase OafA/YrhL
VNTDAGPKAPPGNPHFPLTDSLRALAILGVVLYHCSIVAFHKTWWGDLISNAVTMVDVFFLISAFLLYRPYVMARAEGRAPPGAGRFARRRALRILPGYWVALTLLALWPGVPGVFSHDWWRYYGLLQIYPVGGNGQGLVVAWSLCVELSFYLLLPVYGLALARLASPANSRRWMWREAGILGLLAAGSVLLRYGIWFWGWPGWLNTSLLGRFDYFALGMALALVSVAVARAARAPWWVRSIDRYPGVCILLAAAAYLLMARVAPWPYPNVPALHLVAAPMSFVHHEANYWLSAAFALLLLAPAVFGDQSRGLTRRVLAARPLVALGVISYGVYLYHTPLLSWTVPFIGSHSWTWFGGTSVPALTLATLALTIPAAILSYRYVEAPFLRRRYVKPWRLAARRARGTTASESAGGA